jgi:serine O-acetyltransferase
MTSIDLQSSLPPSKLAGYVARQTSFFAQDETPDTEAQIFPLIEPALRRVGRSFIEIKKKYYVNSRGPVFDHLNSDHYATFLYFLSNTAYKQGQLDIATKCFLLNKCLHGIDAFYSIELPEIFLLVHPLGTVLGNAKYSNFLVVYQNCTVGATEDGVYPEFSGETVLFSGSSVLGATVVGRDVVFGANAFALNSTIPAATTVVGSYPNLRFLPNTSSVKTRFFS